MRDFLTVLLRRYRDELTSASAEEVVDDQYLADLGQSITSLVLADSALAKADLCEQAPELPLQIVVVGPTQVGKSSVVNWLVKRQLAVASAVAGFTVHCQGYLVGEVPVEVSGQTIEQQLSSYFGDITLQTQAALDRQVLGEYSFTHIEDTDPQLAGIVLWDTPDFDSIDSFGYRVPVLRAMALADLVVFVVSKEKYADKTVWDMLQLLHQLKLPVMVVMNKTEQAVRDDLLQSYKSKYQRLLAADPTNQRTPEMLFIDDYEGGLNDVVPNAELVDFRATVLNSATRTSADQLRSNTVHLMNEHWASWTSPISNDHRLTDEWKTIVDGVCDDLVARYQGEYLDHARYKETFQLALAELLVLLEVPGLAEPLGKIRNLVTWPMRKLLSTAKDVQTRKVTVNDDRSVERRLLEELYQHGLSRVSSRVLAKQSDADWWKDLHARVDDQQTIVVDGYHQSLDNYQVLLQVEIERAAQALYQRLQDQPATLNSLRAARVTADAAAVVLAVKSGGLGAVDLVLAPAMLSLTSILAEGVLGQYMQKVQSDLRSYQKKEVSRLLRKKFRARLYPMAAGPAEDRNQLVTESELQLAADKLERGDV